MARRPIWGWGQWYRTALLCPGVQVSPAGSGEFLLQLLGMFSADNAPQSVLFSRILGAGWLKRAVMSRVHLLPRAAHIH